ncbi:hypothetical protein KF913_10125 [Candidatus Obscuribacterales bacterium]|nr:hypothetical protein [Candidatus Obscuribacterales bacterium]
MDPQDDEANNDAQGGHTSLPGVSPTGAGNAFPSGEQFTESLSLVDELDVRDLKKTLRDSRGKTFSSAGRNAPVAEFTDEFLVLHPPQLPFQDADEGPAEEIVLMMDDAGIIVDVWGERKRVPGAKFNGRSLYYYWEQKPGTLKHYAVFFDDDNNHHFLTVEGERITVDVVYKLRNMTHDGELTRFRELTAD